jgi:hypothetical protein
VTNNFVFGNQAVESFLELDRKNNFGYCYQSANISF